MSINTVVRHEMPDGTVKLYYDGDYVLKLAEDLDFYKLESSNMREMYEEQDKYIQQLKERIAELEMALIRMNPNPV